ncbi:hypothetical protein [Candidatus Kryptobacter tengchongensis]|uniref:hypothetical protein n=1 Tax=Kryptobacter tengchongensis TaxID=1643429 RepID=UPI0013520C25|nr:hypothetical protein [Candidatus Kryptobacter tengchongensis]
MLKNQRNFIFPKKIFQLYEIANTLGSEIIGDPEFEIRRVAEIQNVRAGAN